jgi:hypothetical protein
MQFVSNWRDAWKWFSVRVAAIIIALPLAWMAIPDEVKAYMPDAWKPWVMMALGLAVIAGRMIDQNSDKPA